MSVNLLPFLRGLDISCQDFKNDFPQNVSKMKGLHWIKAQNADLYQLPDELENLEKLETIIFSNNNIQNLPKWISSKPNLRNIIIKNNKLNTSSFVSEMFTLKDLSILDLNNNNIERIPAEMIQAQQLQVLNLANNKICKLPNHLFSNLIDLLYLDLSGNQLTTLPPQLRRMTRLQTLILNDNPMQNFQFRQLPWLTGLKTLKMRNTGRNMNNIPTNLENLIHLEDLDLSCNNLIWVPEQLFKLKNLKRLNLSENLITAIPSKIEFLESLEVLNLCSNTIKTLPSTLCKLSSLRRLYLDDNQIEIDGLPLSLYRLRNLQVLSMADNLLLTVPETLAECTNLKSLILSNNKLTSLPNQLFLLNNLKTIDTHNNAKFKLPTKKEIQFMKIQQCKKSIGIQNALEITSQCQLSGDQTIIDQSLNSDAAIDAIQSSADLEFYNINFDLRHHLNKAAVGVLGDKTRSPKSEILADRKACVNSFLSQQPHRKSYEGAVSTRYLEPNSASNMKTNRSAAITEGETERKVLKGMSDLNASNYERRQNRLESKISQAGGDDEFFSREENDANIYTPSTNFNCKIGSSSFSQHPESEIDRINNAMDYSDFFEPNVGLNPGVMCWEIENFLPNRLDDALIGKFYDADCYIVLKTYYSQEHENSSLAWKIFYWIGKRAPLDKQACAAMHAVNLRNFLKGSTCRTAREEQGDESPEFMEVFDYNVKYIEGGRTPTGFYTVVPKEHSTRLFRCTCEGNNINIEPVPLSPYSFESHHSFILDSPKTLYVWQGTKCKSTIASKIRLLAEKIINVERKRECSLVFLQEGKEPANFSPFLASVADQNVVRIDSHDDRIGAGPLTTSTSNEDKCGNEEKDRICNDLDLAPTRRRDKFILYKVGLGAGYLELTQVRIPLKGSNLTKSILDSKNVYILDTYGCDVFVWVGKKANRLVRTAAFKLAKEVIYDFVTRPTYGEIFHLFEGTESQLFKCKFQGWNDVLAVDHTRSAQSIINKGLDMEKILKDVKNDVDLSALFKVRQPPLNSEKAFSIMNEWNEDLEAMECFVLDGKKYVKLPENEIGQFYSAACYAFICRYWVAVEIKNQAVLTIKALKNSTKHGEANYEEGDDMAEEAGHDKELDNVKANNDGDSTTPIHDRRLWEEKFQPVIYFWQGRDASPIGWLTFSFGLGKKFEQTFGKDNLQVVRVLQQQESPKFLSHFERRFVIHSGPRPSIFNITNLTNTNSNSNSTNDNLKHDVPSLYQLRTNNDTVFYTRCIQLPHIGASSFSSAFCYILKVPFKNGTETILKARQEKSYEISTDLGICFVWVGNKSPKDEPKLAEEIANRISTSPELTVTVIKEGQETDTFWDSIGGKKPYEQDANFMKNLRLFRCSNEMGYFRVTERCADFCQDDLCDEDIMILDDGHKVFIWIGPQSSEIEMKLALKSAKLYVEHQGIVCPERPRKLVFTIKGFESSQFKKCFHAWDHHKNKLG